MWTPRIGVQADVVSGDAGHRGGSLGTFNPLFFKAGYFNDSSLIRPSNIVDIHPTVQFSPTNSLLITIGSDVIWRYETKDGVYGPSGNVELPAGGHSHYVATTADISAQWQLGRHLVWILAYNHFFTGSYVRSVEGGSVDFVGSWVTFLF
jgi:hypothetical protein